MIDNIKDIVCNKIFLIILLFTSEFIYLSIYFLPFEKESLYVAVSLIASLLFIVLWLIISSDRLRKDSALLWIIIVFGLLFRLTVFPINPIGSDDVYRYLWDGKVQFYGINPYQYSPLDPALYHVHSERLPGLINFPEMKTVYPPLAEWIFYLSYAFSGESIIGLKILMLIAEMATVWLLLVLIRTMGGYDWYIALYALSPLPILQFFLESHLDIFAFPFLLMFLLFLQKGKPILSGIWLGLSILVKLFPIVAIPAVVYHYRSKITMLAMTIALCIPVVSYTPYILTGGFPLESLQTYATHWEANGSFFLIITSLVGDNQKAHLIVMGLTILFILLTMIKNDSQHDHLFRTIFIVLLLSPTVHVWYVTWIALLLPLVRRWSGILFTTFISLATIPIIAFKSTGIWSQSIIITLLIYIPVIIFFVIEEFRHSKLHSGSEHPSYDIPRSS